jgi:hypothetical protein
MRGAVWTVKPHHVYRAELGVYVFGVSWVLCGCVCVWCVVGAVWVCMCLVCRVCGGISGVHHGNGALHGGIGSEVEQ